MLTKIINLLIILIVYAFILFALTYDPYIEIELNCSNNECVGVQKINNVIDVYCDHKYIGVYTVDNCFGSCTLYKICNCSNYIDNYSIIPNEPKCIEKIFSIKTIIMFILFIFYTLTILNDICGI